MRHFQVVTVCLPIAFRFFLPHLQRENVMFSLFSTSQVEELVILVLDSQYNEEFSVQECIVLAVPSRASIEELKRRIQGATSIPNERIMLLFCGQPLAGPKIFIPPEAFELSGLEDEDTNLFRPRLCMQIIADPVVHTQEEDDDALRRETDRKDEGDKKEVKAKHRKKNKSKGAFDLEAELAAVQCAPFAAILTKQDYNNEGSFAFLTLEALRGPGLWIPLGAARRILTACAKVKKRLADKDREGRRNHYRNMDLSATAAAPAPGTSAAPSTSAPGASNNHTAAAGEADHDDNEHEHDVDEKKAPSEASTAITAVAKNKADARRDWEAEIIRQKRVAKEEAALLKSGKGKKAPTDALKEHSEELTARIAQIRARCAREAEESAADFDEVTGILYSSYARMRAANQALLRGQQGGAKDGKPHAIAGSHGHGHELASDEQPRAASAGALVAAQTAAATAVANHSSHNGTGSPSRVLRALRSSASSASFSGTAGTTTHPPPYPQHQGFCCKKHTRAVLDNREVYLARRKVERALELTVLLDRLPSAQHGYVTSHSLRAIAARYLAGYRGMPPRSSDPALVVQSVEACRLDLPAQRAIVLCVQPKEVMHENLASVLPVVWYCPRVFVRRFVDLLEDLDRERLDADEMTS